MVQQFAFFGSIVFAFAAWGIVTVRYIWPALRRLPRVEALQYLLVLHTFRFVGLAFVVPGVASADLPSSFSYPAAYGDVIAAALALLAFLSLRRRAGVLMTWIFNLWGSADLLNAFFQAGHAGLFPGQLGSTYFLPTFVVPLLLITHGLVFRLLMQHQRQRGMQESPRPA